MYRNKMKTKKQKNKIMELTSTYVHDLHKCRTWLKPQKFSLVRLQHECHQIVVWVSTVWRHLVHDHKVHEGVFEKTQVPSSVHVCMVCVCVFLLAQAPQRPAHVLNSYLRQRRATGWFLGGTSVLQTEEQHVQSEVGEQMILIPFSPNEL